jgi:hypothetical protein
MKIAFLLENPFLECLECLLHNKRNLVNFVYNSGRDQTRDVYNDILCSNISFQLSLGGWGGKGAWDAGESVEMSPSVGGQACIEALMQAKRHLCTPHMFCARIFLTPLTHNPQLCQHPFQRCTALSI